MQHTSWFELRQFLIQLWTETLPTDGDFNVAKWEEWLEDKEVKWENKPIHDMLCKILDKMTELEQRPIYREDRRIK